MAEEQVLDLDKKDPKVYEIGYLLVPFVGEAEKDSTVKKEIISVIEKRGGKLMSEIAPSMRKLAYSIRKMINNKYSVFRDGYFGAVKFELNPAETAELNKDLFKSDSIIRFLLLETDRAGELKLRMPTSSRMITTPVFAKPNPVETEKAPAPESTEKAIDKEIDDLLVTSS